MCHVYFTYLHICKVVYFMAVHSFFYECSFGKKVKYLSAHFAVFPFMKKKKNTEKKEGNV